MITIVFLLRTTIKEESIMPKFNENYFHLKESYLFSEIAHRVNAYTKKNVGISNKKSNRGNRHKYFVNGVI